jgi:hypothetical protein
MRLALLYRLSTDAPMRGLHFYVPHPNPKPPNARGWSSNGLDHISAIECIRK